MATNKRQTNETLRSDIWRACDILRRDNNVSGVVQYTEHLAWLLFLKFLDEEEKERLAQAALGDGEHYEPVLQGDLAWDAWAGPAKLAAWKVEDLIQFVRGRKPGLDMCKALATFFRVPLDHVLRLAGHTEVASTLASLPPEILVLVHEIEQLPAPVQKAAVKAWAAVLEGIRSAQGPTSGEKP